MTNLALNFFGTGIVLLIILAGCLLGALMNDIKIVQSSFATLSIAWPVTFFEVLAILRSPEPSTSSS